MPNANRSTMQILWPRVTLPRPRATCDAAQAVITEIRTSGHPKWRAAYQQRGTLWETDFEASRAILFEARGQFREAETAYQRASDYKKASLPALKNMEFPPPESLLRHGADFDILSAARMKAKQGRLAEAEADARRALLSRLKEQGKYNPLTTKIRQSAWRRFWSSRAAMRDAEKLIRAALEIQRTVGIADDTQFSAQILSQLGAHPDLAAQAAGGRNGLCRARQGDRQLGAAAPADARAQRLAHRRALSPPVRSRPDIAAAQALLKREIGRVGEKHFDTAAARGTLAVGYHAGRRDADAVREFKAAIPVLMAAARENADDDDDTVVAARSLRLQNIVEAYIACSPRQRQMPAAMSRWKPSALADAIRGQIGAAGADGLERAHVGKDPALADLVRKEQDLGQADQCAARRAQQCASLPSTQRDENVVKATTPRSTSCAPIATRRAQRSTSAFPSYADLIDPKPPTVDADQGDAARRRSDAVVLFRAGRKFRVGGAEGRAGGVCGRSRRPPAISKARCASCARRWSRRRR